MQVDTPNDCNTFVHTDFITHVVYVRQGSVDPCVEALNELGIQCIGVDGESEESATISESSTWTVSEVSIYMYDLQQRALASLALYRVLKDLVGRNDD